MTITQDGSWSLGIGDATIAGWLTVFLYLLTSWQCYRVAVRANRIDRSSHLLPTQSSPQPWFWRGLAVLLLALGLNKQLDLQTLLTQTAKSFYIEQGWYEHRRDHQLMFIKIAMVLAVTSVIALALKLYQSIRLLWLALLGLVILLSFVMIRAVSFHHVDLLINQSYLGVRINNMLEIPGIAFILFNSVTIRRAQRKATLK